MNKIILIENRNKDIIFNYKSDTIKVTCRDTGSCVYLSLTSRAKFLDYEESKGKDLRANWYSQQQPRPLDKRIKTFCVYFNTGGVKHKSFEEFLKPSNVDFIKIKYDDDDIKYYSQIKSV
ncbi:hypothetical protein [Xenorhabdus kozodoii]|uniref:MSV199 domain-containing protein n=1 Tax=Xenorhabdus kozodoii TaxID=351676 RepID=A0A2D0KZL8_9GAMM|nr:hypothetical protein [Xenorhabdus kozodoii]PHM68848.1 hypothetical protein Xkoz_03616 [Xenorhabdus kozodoii]